MDSEIQSYDNNIPLEEEEIQIQKPKEKKPRKPLTEKQKEILNNGRLLLKQNKEKQKIETEQYKEKLVLKKAEMIKNRKANIKIKLALPPDMNSESEEEEKIVIKKKPKKKVVYVEESSDEEPVVLKKIKKPKDVIPPPPPETPVVLHKKLIFF
jgi:hypothetical protein